MTITGHVDTNVAGFSTAGSTSTTFLETGDPLEYPASPKGIKVEGVRPQVSTPPLTVI